MPKSFGYLRPWDLQLLDTQKLLIFSTTVRKQTIGLNELNELVVDSEIDDQVTCVFKMFYSESDKNHKFIVTYTGNGEFYFNSTRIKQKGTTMEMVSGSTIRIKNYTYLFFLGDANGLKKDEEQEVSISEDSKVTITNSILGRGANSKVFYTYLPSHPRLQLACKETILDDPYSHQVIGGLTRRELVRREMEILKDLSHANVAMFIHSEEYIKPEKNKQSVRMCRMFMPFYSYGTLQNYINNGRVERDQSARFIFYQIMLGLRYIHRKGLIHKDIKPDNILIDGKSGLPRAIISDFGVALSKNEARTRTGRFGTSMYNAPETLGRIQEYDEKVDCWAAGIVLFNMLTDGEHPFSASTDNLEFSQEHILVKEPCMDYDFAQDENNHGKELILRLLDKNPKTRASCDECIQSKWVREPSWRNECFVHYSNLTQAFFFEKKIWVDIMKKKNKGSPLLFSKKLKSNSIPRWWRSLKKTDYIMDGARHHFLRKGTYGLSYKVTKRNASKKITIHGNLRQYLDDRVQVKDFDEPGSFVTAT